MRIRNLLAPALLMAAALFADDAYQTKELTPEEKGAIEAAVPRKAPARPTKPRKLLIVHINRNGDRPGPGHASIPYANYAFVLMGKLTGAYQATINNDESVFRPENLKQYDALIFNNTVGVLFDDPALRQSLLDYVRLGKGFVGIHGASSTFVRYPRYDIFPEYGRMVGGFEDGGHPWGPNEKIAIKVDDPNHPVNAPFHGQGFEIDDEAEQFREPTLRDRLHVLLSVDVAKTGPPHRVLKQRQQDMDFPMSWVKSYGEGRVFYTGMGHGPKAFLQPALLAHYLAGIQFALGDLKGAADGSSKIRGVPDVIGYHRVKTDPSGKIVPWYGNSPAEAYDHVVRLVADFWRNMRSCENGVPYYLQHQVWTPVVDDARGLGGDQIPMALSSWNLLHGYLGDPWARQNMILMADYWLAHGMSKPGDKWANLPYPYNTGIHSGQYDGDMRAGKGFLQPDKAGSFGAELVVMYKLTGNRRYLDAAVRIADTLAARVEPGDGERSPWPFRVHSATGEVHRQEKGGKTYTASYTSNYTGALRLFGDLIAIRQGNGKAYAAARKMVSDWLRTYPLKTSKWGPFFEDVPTADYSDTEINADTMVTYILEHPEFDERWKEYARSALDWSHRTFENREYAAFDVFPINEQTAYRVPGNSHTSRHASVELLYCAKTGDCAQKEEAIRQLNWATYTVDTDGKNRYIRDQNWLTDGYGDYVRHYLRAMAAAPELAPADQNHLLRSSSVVQAIAYGPNAISYTKFDSGSTEQFKLGAWQPASVSGGKMEWDPLTKVLTVHATAKSVTIAASN